MASAFRPRVDPMVNPRVRPRANSNCSANVAFDGHSPRRQAPAPPLGVMGGVWALPPTAPPAVIPDIGRNAARAMGCGPMHRAAAHDDALGLQTLLQSASRIGPDAAVELANKGDRSGRSPLHLAARTGAVRAVSVLVAAGASVNARDAWRQTPLHEVAGAPPDVEGRLEAAWRLMDAMADITVTDKAGDTPLHRAAHYGNLGMCGLLLERLADPGTCDLDGRTPVEIAVTGLQHEAAAKLKELCRLDVHLQLPSLSDASPTSGPATDAQNGNLIETELISGSVWVRRKATASEVCGRMSSLLGPEVCDYISRALGCESETSSQWAWPLKWHLVEQFLVEGNILQWLVPSETLDFLINRRELIVRIPPEGCARLADVLDKGCEAKAAESASKTWWQQPWRVAFQPSLVPPEVCWSSCVNGWEVAPLPESHPLAYSLCRAFNQTCRERTAVPSGVRLLRSREWLDAFEITISDLEGRLLHPVEEDAELMKRMAALPKKRDSTHPFLGYRLFTKAAFLDTGRVVHLNEPAENPLGSPIGSSLLLPELFSFLEMMAESALGARAIGFGKVRLLLAWQGAASEDPLQSRDRLERCLANPSLVKGEADGFPRPVLLAACADTAKVGLRPGWPIRSAGATESPGDGAVVVFAAVQRSVFPLSRKRCYNRFYRPDLTAETGDPELCIRGHALPPGFDSWAFNAGGGFAHSQARRYPLEYELAFADASHVLPIAVLDFTATCRRSAADLPALKQALDERFQERRTMWPVSAR
eukprot:TRINITY_DN106206_c0_g1_i1.p1 TRINITY_DN106206_c0_g1~~TRINITY_DN106206_c0_g1_i1.p1  ORF type:complete len:764 (+),score=100.27 TRINITY_DN106206_c0_g1_i1:56-2347(+)